VNRLLAHAVISIRALPSTLTLPLAAPPPGVPLSESQLAHLLSDCDTDHKGTVLYADFLGRYGELVEQGQVKGVSQAAAAVHQAAGLWRFDATAPDHWRAEAHAKVPACLPACLPAWVEAPGLTRVIWFDARSSGECPVVVGVPLQGYPSMAVCDR